MIVIKYGRYARVKEDDHSDNTFTNVHTILKIVYRFGSLISHTIVGFCVNFYLKRKTLNISYSMKCTSVIMNKWLINHKLEDWGHRNIKPIEVHDCSNH